MLSLHFPEDTRDGDSRWRARQILDEDVFDAGQGPAISESLFRCLVSCLLCSFDWRWAVTI